MAEADGVCPPAAAMAVAEPEQQEQQQHMSDTTIIDAPVDEATTPQEHMSASMAGADEGAIQEAGAELEATPAVSEAATTTSPIDDASAIAPAPSLSAPTPMILLRVCEELQHTERVYQQCVSTLLHCYLQPLQDPATCASLGQNDDAHKAWRSCWGALEPLERLHMALAGSLAAVDLTRPVGDIVLAMAEIFIQNAPYFKLNCSYVDGYLPCMELVAPSPGSGTGTGGGVDKKFLAWQEKQRTAAMTVGYSAQTLQSLIIMPIQRVPRYELLLNKIAEEFDKYLSLHSPSFASSEHSFLAHVRSKLADACVRVKGSSLHLNEWKRKSESEARLMSLHSSIRGLPTGYLVLESHRRYLADTAAVQIFPHASRKALRLWLTNDVLILVSADKNKCKGWIQLADVTMVTRHTADGEAEGQAAGGKEMESAIFKDRCLSIRSAMDHVHGVSASALAAATSPPMLPMDSPTSASSSTPSSSLGTLEFPLQGMMSSAPPPMPRARGNSRKSFTPQPKRTIQARIRKSLAAPLMLSMGAIGGAESFGSPSSSSSLHASTAAAGLGGSATMGPGGVVDLSASLLVVEFMDAATQEKWAKLLQSAMEAAKDSRGLKYATATPATMQPLQPLPAIVTPTSAATVSAPAPAPATAVAVVVDAPTEAPEAPAEVPSAPMASLPVEADADADATALTLEAPSEVGAAKKRLRVSGGVSPSTLSPVRGRKSNLRLSHSGSPSSVMAELERRVAYAAAHPPSPMRRHSPVRRRRSLLMGNWSPDSNNLLPIVAIDDDDGEPQDWEMQQQQQQQQQQEQEQQEEERKEQPEAAEGSDGMQQGENEHKDASEEHGSIPMQVNIEEASPSSLDAAPSSSACAAALSSAAASIGGAKSTFSAMAMVQQMAHSLFSHHTSAPVAPSPLGVASGPAATSVAALAASPSRRHHLRVPSCASPDLACIGEEDESDLNQSLLNQSTASVGSGRKKRSFGEAGLAKAQPEEAEALVVPVPDPDVTDLAAVHLDLMEEAAQMDSEADAQQQQQVQEEQDEEAEAEADAAAHLVRWHVPSADELPPAEQPLPPPTFDFMPVTRSASAASRHQHSSSLESVSLASTTSSAQPSPASTPRGSASARSRAALKSTASGRKLRDYQAGLALPDASASLLSSSGVPASNILACGSGGDMLSARALLQASSVPFYARKTASSAAKRKSTGGAQKKGHHVATASTSSAAQKLKEAEKKNAKKKEGPSAREAAAPVVPAEAKAVAPASARGALTHRAHMPVDRRRRQELKDAAAARSLATERAAEAVLAATVDAKSREPAAARRCLTEARQTNYIPEFYWPGTVQTSEAGPTFHAEVPSPPPASLPTRAALSPSHAHLASPPQPQALELAPSPAAGASVHVPRGKHRKALSMAMMDMMPSKADTMALVQKARQMQAQAQAEAGGEEPEGDENRCA